ncbi:hypothetical protein TIFTF001_004876 [Ficus carica]|uniref:Uncharacterized protein n=1 Tax=Ficus carica TaxID=3494 RepID=A0AA87ZZR4_FICCA|nr:hypothetical protein TIFTF001_004876 [Ficus carica]
MRPIPRHSTHMDRLKACTKDLAGLVTKFVTTVNATLSIDRQQTPPTNSRSVGDKYSGQAKEEDQLDEWLGGDPIAKQQGFQEQNYPTQSKNKPTQKEKTRTSVF